ncbi:MAG: hypothetical protein AAF570_25500, partial [Bacteroidota bacterium]
PDLVKEYIGKIDALQLNYIRMLNTQDKMPAVLDRDDPQMLRRQIEEIRGGMGDDSPKLREVKQKRIKLLQKRIRNYHEGQDSQQMIDQQLKTIEEMVNFFHEQPLADQSKDEVGIIDSLLTETNDIHDTLSEVEGIMRSNEIANPAPNSPNLYAGGGQEITIE